MMSSENLVAQKFVQRRFALKSFFGGGANQIVLTTLVVVFICICMPRTSWAKSDPDEVETLDNLVKSLYRDTKHVMTSPLRWGQDDLVLFATLSASTFALMLTDTDLQESIQENRIHTIDQISKWTDRYTKRVTNLTIGGLYFSGLILQDQRAKETALLCFESVALAEGITKGLKHLIGRSRPFGNKGAFNFNPLKVPPPYYSLSFPSGHATTAFALSSVLAEQYQNWWVKLIAYSFALVVSWARVNNNAYFLSDVFWGGIIGISVGRCLVKFHEKDGWLNWELISTNGPDNVKLAISIWVK